MPAVLPKRHVIHLYLDVDDYARVELSARKAYLSVPQYIRKRLGIEKQPERRGGNRRKPRMVQPPLFPEAPASEPMAIAVNSEPIARVS